MTTLLDPLPADELGRSGLANKSARVAEQKKQHYRSVFNKAAGAVMIGIAALGCVEGYIQYENWANDPQTVELWTKRQEAERAQRSADAQEKITAEQKEAADIAIAKAQKEAEIAMQNRQAEQKKAAQVEGMFARASYKQAVCGPYDIKINITYNADGSVKEFTNSNDLYIGSEDAAKKTELRNECLTTFPFGQLLATRGLGEQPTSAHYTLLKDLFAKCGGVEAEDLTHNQYKDGSADVSFRMWSKIGSFSKPEDYKNYQSCLIENLTDPFINTSGVTTQHLSMQ